MTSGPPPTGLYCFLGTLGSIWSPLKGAEPMSGLAARVLEIRVSCPDSRCGSPSQGRTESCRESPPPRCLQRWVHSWPLPPQPGPPSGWLRIHSRWRRWGLPSGLSLTQAPLPLAHPPRQLHPCVTWSRAASR